VGVWHEITTAGLLLVYTYRPLDKLMTVRRDSHDNPLFLVLSEESAMSPGCRTPLTSSDKFSTGLV